jgi:hypothetical protein
MQGAQFRRAVEAVAQVVNQPISNIWFNARCDDSKRGAYDNCQPRRGAGQVIKQVTKFWLMSREVRK